MPTELQKLAKAVAEIRKNLPAHGKRYSTVVETTWHHTQKVQRHRDGTATLTFRVDGLNEILRWLLGWAGRAVVVRPPELRMLVVQQLRTALQMHEE